jgi:BTB/POZ domain-containing protein KCTD9
MDNLPNIDELRKSFSGIYNGPNDLQREYDIVGEAERLNMPVKTYRRLYQLRGEEESAAYPNPNNWHKAIPEWYEWFSMLPPKEKFFLSRKGVFWLLQKGVLLTGVLALFHYVWETPTRQKQAHYQAWQTINSASLLVSSDANLKRENLQGESSSMQGIEPHLGKIPSNFKLIPEGSSGRIEAMQDLAKDGVSMRFLFAPNAILGSINLENANLQYAYLYLANLENANLENANLANAYLFGVKFHSANLENANLHNAYLKDAQFYHAKLQNAYLKDANLQDADFGSAQLKNANFGDADLTNANFQNANIEKVNFQNADRQSGNKSLTISQVKAAKNWEKASYSPEFRKQLGLPPEKPNDDNKQVSPFKSIVNKLSEKCIDVDGDPGNNNGDKLQLWDCETSKHNRENGSHKNQRWKLENEFIINESSKKCIDVVVDSTRDDDNGYKLQLWDCETSEHNGKNGSRRNQRWTLQNNGFIVNKLLPKKCIDIQGAPGENNGDRLQLWDCESSGYNRDNGTFTDQRWKLQN